MDKTSILVVDDDPIALEVARERLEALGFDVFTRGESLGTSAWILQNRPDFVLLDVVMPALTGGELAGLMKRRGVRTAIILHSSKSSRELKALAQETGALGSISKELDERRFSSEVVRLVQQARARAAQRGRTSRENEQE